MYHVSATILGTYYTERPSPAGDWITFDEIDNILVPRAEGHRRPVRRLPASSTAGFG